jgi:hypothetical protein
MTDPIPDDIFEPTDLISDAPSLPADVPSALERLGPTPFPKSKFPFLGFLATVYDHVATHCQGDTNAGAGGQNGQEKG